MGGVYKVLEGHKSVLLAGCGGGYDVFTALPLYFYLRSKGITCHLASLSFSERAKLEAFPCLTKDASRVFEIHPSKSSYDHEEAVTKIDRPPPETLAQIEMDWETYQAKERHYRSYFPEYLLAAQLDVPVWTFPEEGGAVGLHKAYQALVSHLEPDAIVLCDGGYDSLMFGHEKGLGTPHEDMMSVAAVDMLPRTLPTYLLCLGARIELGIDDRDFFASWASLVKDGGFHGLEFLHRSSPHVQGYKKVFEACQPVNSIINAQVLAATEGEFGDFHSPHVKARTKGSTQKIDPLTATYFLFSLPHVASRITYLDKMKTTTDSFQIDEIISSL